MRQGARKPRLTLAFWLVSGWWVFPREGGRGDDSGGQFPGLTLGLSLPAAP